MNAGSKMEDLLLCSHRVQARASFPWTLQRVGPRVLLYQPLTEKPWQGQDSRVADLKPLPCSMAPSPAPILQPQGLREQIPYMLVARGRTKEVSWREVSTVKKELENMTPPTLVNYWPGQARGKKGSLNPSSLTPATHLGLAFEPEARQPVSCLAHSTQGQACCSLGSLGKKAVGSANHVHSGSVLAPSTVQTSQRVQLARKEAESLHPT